MLVLVAEVDVSWLQLLGRDLLWLLSLRVCCH